MVDAGLIVLVSFISPFKAERALARSKVGEHEFVEVHVDTPLAVAEARDIKGLYEKARTGEIKHFTGISSPYEQPEHAEITVGTAGRTPEDCAAEIVAYLRKQGIVP